MELINNNTNFKLTNLKFTKYHFMSGEVYNGCPIKTSIEIKFDNYNLSTNKEITTKCIEHTYMLEHNFEKQTNFQQYELENSENIIKSLEQIDFKNLKNNYFSNDSFHRHSHWELEYNNYFKIVGTFDNEIDEIKKIKRILDFEQIERQELEKVEEKIKNTKFSISIKDAIKNFIYKMQTASDIENGLFDGTIIFDIKDEEEFTELTEELNKLYNISDNETQLHNNDDTKQFLINWLKKIEEVNKLVDEEIEKYNIAVKNNLPTEDQATILRKISELRGIKNEEKYYYEFIPYKKIGPISLDKNEYLKPNGVPYLYENSLNHVLCQPLGIDYPDHIKKSKKRDYVYIEYGNTIIELTCKFEKLKNDLDKICDDIILSKEDDCYLVASSKKLGIIIIAEKNNNQEYKDEFEFYIRYIKFVGKEQFKKFEDEERNNKMNKELKINNNVVFEDEETKVEFQKYLDEINEYNRKIQNGEDPGVNPADLLNKYREKFCDEELENKMIELDDKKNNFKFENNEMDELINKIDAKKAELDEKNKE